MILPILSVVDVIVWILVLLVISAGVSLIIGAIFYHKGKDYENRSDKRRNG